MLLEPCQAELPPPTDGSRRGIVLAFQEWAQAYHECADRHRALSGAVR